jgi:uncharacterized protein YndB with AHSA1/START domain
MRNEDEHDLAFEASPASVRNDERAHPLAPLRTRSTDAAGKTTAHTDTYHGRFMKLVPNEQIVEVDEFETDDPALRGEMTITISLTDSGGGTTLHAVHDGLPSGVPPSDNETGWRMALDKLAVLAEARGNRGR